MKIQLNDLPAEGLTVSDTLPLEPLLARMNEGRGNDIVFTQPPSVTVTISRRPDGAVLSGKASSTITQACGRCLDPKIKPIEVSLDFLVVSADPGKGDEEAEGVLYADGDQVELDSAVYEALILALTLYWSPPLNKKGRCSDCGKEEKDFAQCLDEDDQPRGTRLGDLLKKLH